MVRFSSCFPTLNASLMALGMVLFVPLGGSVISAAPAHAQSGGMFSPVMTVNGVGISRYEIDQRVKFLQLLRQTGDLQKQAQDGLIEDRLRMWRAKIDDVSATTEAINDGMTEFAGRANLSREEFVAELAKQGISEQTFRDFVTAGVVWRDVVRMHFGSRVKITDADIDRAMRPEAQRGTGTRVLLSEVIIPAPPEYIAEARDLAKRVSEVHGESAFASAAEQVSAASTREKGGRLDWMPLQNLPPQLRNTVLAMTPGQISAPVELNGMIAIFMLRGMDEGGATNRGAQKLGYAMLTLGPVGSPQAAKLAEQVAANAKGCDDLYTVAKDLPPSQLVRVDGQAQSAIPSDIGLALAHLDPGETTRLQRGGADVALMLCGRETATDTKTDPKTAEAGAPADATKPDTPPLRDQVRMQLMNKQFNSYADSYLADLKANAVIVKQ